MDVRQIDLNLLVVFAALFEHRSVTRAAEAVGLSQPAMSAALARLRAQFDDALFVRSGAQMKPTPRAQALALPVQRVMDTVRSDILPSAGFEAARSDRRFGLLLPDIGEVHFLPALLRRVATAAPGVQLQSQDRPRQGAAEALTSGAADLAVGYFPELRKPGFFHQKLFDNPHVCLARRGHPAFEPRLTKKAFLAAEHAVVRREGREGREHVFEQFLQQRGLQRRVVLELSHYMSLVPVLADSDLLASVPRDLADVCTRHAALQQAELPFPSPVVAVHQSWHERVHRDAACVWLRGVVKAEFGLSR